ncbi:hypothetical protein GPECTOR_78g51 [Gonium pectorale]|uniref:Uncharacterized protein n=1 Tax=Gonium pectorale TaxID=33097 RepID=A0A150G211_GONPE|nr:hypothetical protein GPECTOR_78g51 [Gonium pectorale]|eukprot:KXZ43863.1 hypothetical protein GPECTOR_78g51 [Gonium pectorale]
MLVSLSQPPGQAASSALHGSAAPVAATAAASGGGSHRQLVLATVETLEEEDPYYARRRARNARYQNTSEKTVDKLGVMCLPASTTFETAVGKVEGSPDGGNEGGVATAPTALATLPPPNEFIAVNDPAALRAVRAARERAFLEHARERWWHLQLCAHVKTAQQSNSDVLGLQLPLDSSMVRLVYDLGLLPPLEEAVKSGPPAVEDATEGHGAAGEEDACGKQHLIQNKRPAGAEPCISDVRLQLAWPYTTPRLDAPTWAYDQRLHSTFLPSYAVQLSSRQWQELLAPLAPDTQALDQALAQHSHGGAAAALASVLGALHQQPGGGHSAAYAQLGDPFEAEVVAHEALELRERLTGGTLHAAGSV